MLVVRPQTGGETRATDDGRRTTHDTSIGSRFVVNLDVLSNDVQT